MADTERLVSVNLLGQEYQFYTGSSEVEMDTILNFVRKVMEESGANATSTVPVNKVAVLSCLNMASKYLDLKQEFKEYKEQTESRISHINSEIKDNLFSG